MTGEVDVVAVGAQPEELGEALDRRDRRAQLVGGVGEELAQAHLGRLALAEGLLDLAEHRVEGQPELADLGALVRRCDPLRQVTGGDRAGRGRHVLERAKAPPEDEPGTDGEGGEQHPGRQASIRTSRRRESVSSPRGVATMTVSPGAPSAGPT